MFVSHLNRSIASRWNALSFGKRLLAVVAMILMGFWFTLWQGYCWLGWGRFILPVDAAFQCSCPSISEAFRYRPFEVLASACEELKIEDSSANRRFLLLATEDPRQRTVGVDLDTSARMEVPIQNIQAARPLDVALLGESLIVARTIDYDSTFYVLNIVTGNFIEIASVEAPTPDVKWTAPPIPEETWQRVAQAQHVFLHHFGATYVIVALADETLNNSNQDVLIFSYNGAREGHFQAIEELQRRGISYTTPWSGYPSVEKERGLRDIYGISVDSPDGSLRADQDGITEVRTGKSVVPTWIIAMQRAWVRDGRAVIYAHPYTYKYLIDVGFPLECRYFPVPQPILLLELPPDYQTSKQ